MTYPTPPGGYGGGQGPTAHGPTAHGPTVPSSPRYGPPTPAYGVSPERGPGKGLPFYLNAGIVVLGVVSFLLGFLPYSSGASAEFAGESFSVSVSTNFFMTNGLLSTSFLLAAAIVVGLGMLPKQEVDNGIVVASLSAVGFLSLLFQLISFPSGAKLGFGLILVLIIAFLQAGLAIVVLLYSADILKPPQRSPQPPPQQHGYYGQGGGYEGQTQQLPQQTQPYYGGAQGPAPYPPPSQPHQQQQPHNPW